MSDQHKKACIEEEAFIVLHSGEIPEVAYHGSLYYLTEDPEERNDISAHHPEVVKTIERIMLEAHSPSDVFTYR